MRMACVNWAPRGPSQQGDVFGKWQKVKTLYVTDAPLRQPIRHGIRRITIRHCTTIRQHRRGLPSCADDQTRLSAASQSDTATAASDTAPRCAREGYREGCWTKKQVPGLTPVHLGVQMVPARVRYPQEPPQPLIQRAKPQETRSSTNPAAPQRVPQEGPADRVLRRIRTEKVTETGRPPEPRHGRSAPKRCAKKVAVFRVCSRGVVRCRADPRPSPQRSSVFRTTTRTGTRGHEGTATENKKRQTIPSERTLF